MNHIGELAAKNVHAVAKGWVRIFLSPCIVKTDVVYYQLALIDKKLVFHIVGRGANNESAGLHPFAHHLCVGIGIRGCRCAEIHAVGIAHQSLQGINHFNGGELRMLFLYIGDIAVDTALTASLDLYRVHLGTLSRKSIDSGTAHTAWAVNAQHFRILASKMANTNTGNAARSICRKKICRKQRDGCARILVVQHYHEDGARKAFFLICCVGAIPFAACHIEGAAQVCGHCHETTILALIGRHVRKRRSFGEGNHASMRGAILAAHHEVAHAQALQYFFHSVDAIGDIHNSGLDHVFFIEIKEINCWVTHRCLLARCSLRFACDVLSLDLIMRTGISGLFRGHKGLFA